MNFAQTFTQVAPAQAWTINHAFTNVPITDVVTSISGTITKILPRSVKAVSPTQLLIEFSEPTAGVARLYGNVAEGVPSGSGGIDPPITYAAPGRLFWYDTFTVSSDEAGPTHVPEAGGTYIAYEDINANTGGTVVAADGSFRVDGEQYGGIRLSPFTAGPTRWDEAPYRLTLAMNQMFADGIDGTTHNQSVSAGFQDGPGENEYAMYVSFSRTTSGVNLYAVTPGGSYSLGLIDPVAYGNGEIVFETTYYPLSATTIVKMNGITQINESGVHTPLTLAMSYAFLYLTDALEDGWGITSIRIEQLTTPGVDYGSDA